jgi:hypothetical protein
MLIDFGLIFTSIWFKKPKIRLYAWKAPGDCNQQKYFEEFADTAWSTH